MIRSLVAFVGVTIAILICDIPWLTFSGPVLYKPQLGDMLLEKPLLVWALLFYVTYTVGVTYLIVMPALASGSFGQAVLRGAVFGFVAYATYDFTNMATLRNWSTVVVAADLAWGTFLTAVGSGAGYLLASRFTA